MLTRRCLSIFLLLVAVYYVQAQGLSGTWYGFQVSRDNGQKNEYRITVEITMTGTENFTGTMQLKSPQKGVITSSFSGAIDKTDNLIYLREDKILTDGVEPTDASLCNYVLKLKKNVLKGKGRSMRKGYDHLSLHLERRENY